MEIPGYKIIKKLDKGGMSTVYLAIQSSLDREVALKVMAPELNQDGDFSDRFVREAKIVAQLAHPHIVAIYEVGSIDDHNYLAMDLRERKNHLNLLGIKKHFNILTVNSKAKVTTLRECLFQLDNSRNHNEHSLKKSNQRSLIIQLMIES